jgi:hypothetical protein
MERGKKDGRGGEVSHSGIFGKKLCKYIDIMGL